jgi:hypothetical protein
MDIIPAAELRRIQEGNDNNNGQFVTKFRSACDKYYDILLAEVKRCISNSKNTHRNSFILDERNIKNKVDGFSHSTMLFGFWNSHTRQFNDDIFTKNNIERPFNRAVADLAKLGYTLENISDSCKSFRLFIKLSW